MVTNFIGVDTPYSATTQSLAFRIEDASGNTVWEGVSVPYPGESAVTIWVNRLVADFLGTDWSPETGVTTDSEACRVFYLKDSSGTTLESYRFINGDGVFPGEGVLNDPVNGHLDPRMYFPASVYSATGTTIDIE